MVEVTDITLREANGNYSVVCDLMKIDKWMLESRAFVESSGMAASFLLHLWSDGKVKIITTDHPISFDMPDDDIRELSEWCRINGWQALTIDKDLLEDPAHFEFWLRFFRLGMVFSDELKSYDDNEMSRMSMPDNEE